jgi:hypothetical protein
MTDRNFGDRTMRLFLLSQHGESVLDRSPKVFGKNSLVGKSEQLC